jgi:hypothetical protein
MAIFSEGSTPTSGARYRPELNFLQIIHSEIASVTTAMRKPLRWDHEPHTPQPITIKGIEKVTKFLNSNPLVNPPNEHPLLLPFTELKLLLGQITSIID